ncbi:hypothetical protein [Veillonella ratti]|uniref:hypothetical protein n=1 Tax=Veillonella ratti TaxID=103892 RepID=UPI000F8E1B97|nr:hypothetical protein [Veillonella ratti]
MKKWLSALVLTAVIGLAAYPMVQAYGNSPMNVYQYGNSGYNNVAPCYGYNGYNSNYSKNDNDRNTMMNYDNSYYGRHHMMNNNNNSNYTYCH